MSGAQGLIPPRAARGLLSICFFVSGFNALLYQTVWMRLALARFGVNTSVVATILAVFMLGLAVGSVLATPVLARAAARFGIGPLRVYGLAELVVAIGGLTVPALLAAGRSALLTVGPTNGMLYTLGSSAILTAIFLPFCTAMGFTFPSAIAFLKGAGASDEGRYPFSALYLANVLGALAGAVATPLALIEWFGFLDTSFGAAALNVGIAIATLTAFRGKQAATESVARRVAGPAPVDAASRARRLGLFATGFTTMGMEVVWMRIYPTIIGTFVYSFATIIAVYLLATTLGSALYRRLRLRNVAAWTGLWFPWLGAASLLPLLSASIAFPTMNGFLKVAVGLFPFCALLGFLTPALVDREAGDDAARVGAAYGINLLGCLLGPLVAGFGLLPFIGTPAAALILASPLFLVALLPGMDLRRHAAGGVAALLVASGLWYSTTLFEDTFPKDQVRRDHVATVVAGGTGLDKTLYVNGVGMTVLTSVTKMMAHFPLAHLSRRPDQPLDALVICFGMGTSFRSLASWGANVTAVELVPSVPDLFGHFHPDGPGLVRAANGRLRIVNDDGRRFLDRSPGMYDLITIDPPPPVEAAGSSLLYSKEFYASAKRRMKPGAILQTWLPWGDRETVAGVALAVIESFPYVRVFASIDGNGFHFTASNDPIPRLSAGALASRMPAAAVRDMTEWINAPPEAFFQRMLAGEYVLNSLLIDQSPSATQVISDDRPVNEFYLMRNFAMPADQPPTLGNVPAPAASSR